jgi:antitoxin VapB
MAEPFPLVAKSAIERRRSEEGSAPALASIWRRMYIPDVYRLETASSDTGIAKIFMHGRSQAVRLPLAFRLPGDRVRVRRVNRGILLEPMVTDVDAWFAELDRFADVPFVEDGRCQPPIPLPEDLFE